MSNINDYEKDPRFIEYMKSRLDAALKAKEEGKLIDSAKVFSDLKEKYGWDNE
jgi:hypothetical protein